MLMRDLRETHLRDLADLRSGAISVSQARARAIIVRNIIESHKIELVSQRMAAGDLGILPRVPLAVAAE